MKKFLLCLLFPVLLACQSSSVLQGKEVVNLLYKPKVPDTKNDYALELMSDKTAFDYFRDEGLVVGWNIGNSLDAYVSGRASETGWGNPKINQELLDGVKQAGFNLVRIPVTWIGYIGPEPDYHINEKYLKRVAEVVEMAHNAGLKVIINIHHDGSTANGRDNGWLSINKARGSEEGYKEVTFKFVRVWTQIATYFRNYGDWLIFESMNEIHDGNWGWGSESAQTPQYKIINEWNRLFTKVVRGTGSNNAKRYLVLPGYCTVAKHTIAQYFWLPPDTAPSRQIITFHYYDPHEFCIEGKRTTWGTDNEKKQVENDFALFKDIYINSNIPVIIGECGAVLQINNDEAKDQQARQSRITYITHVFTTAKKYGLVPIYWDNGAIRGNGEKFGLFDRMTGKPNSADSSTLINIIINSTK